MSEEIRSGPSQTLRHVKPGQHRRRTSHVSPVAAAPQSPCLPEQTNVEMAQMNMKLENAMTELAELRAELDHERARRVEELEEVAAADFERSQEREREHAEAMAAVASAREQMVT